MNRSLPTFADACERVKIGLFTKPPYLIDISGVIHVGTNYGYELKWYYQMGIKHIMGFEPLRSAYIQCAQLYPDAKLCPYALGDKDTKIGLNVYAGDGQGSTLLRELNPDPNTIILPTPQRTQTRRFDHIYNAKQIEPYNCLVIDVQGYEQQVLTGFGTLLYKFDCISVELSESPMYEGESPACDVVDYLAKHNFSQITPIEPHNDVLFVKNILI